MEKYGDEGFIKYLNESREDADSDIKKGKIFLAGKILSFKEREIIKDMFWMWLPDEFGPLSKEMARLKYPNERRPDIIYTNTKTTVNITFSHKFDKLDDGQEEEIRDDMAEIVMRLHPGTLITDKDLTEAEGHKLAWFDFTTPAIDTDIYNLMFFTSLKGRLLIGGFNCLDAEQENWKELFIQMLKTARF